MHPGKQGRDHSPETTGLCLASGQPGNSAILAHPALGELLGNQGSSHVIGVPAARGRLIRGRAFTGTPRL